MSKPRRATPAKPSPSTSEPTLLTLHSQEVSEKKARILEAVAALEEDFRIAIENVQARLRELV